MTRALKHYACSLHHKISSAPVLRGRRKERQLTSGVLGFVDVLDLVSIIIRYHLNPRLSAIDALVSKLSLACNFSGNNPYMRLEVSDSLTVADAMPLLIGGVKRLAVTDGKKGIINVLTQSQLLRWLMGRLRELESLGGNESISASSIIQKAERSIESLGLCSYWKREDNDSGKARILVVRSDDTVASAFLLLAENHLSAAPVVDHTTGAILGVFSASDVNKLPHFHADSTGKEQEAAARVTSAFASLNKLNSTVIDYISNKDAEVRGAITVVKSDSIATVCRLLATHSIHRCYLVEEGDTPRPYGIVSIADVLHTIVQPCHVFDASKCRQANTNVHNNLETRFPACLPYRHLFKCDYTGPSGGGPRYVDNPFSPNVCVHVIGHQRRHGNLEINVNVFAIPRKPFSLDNEGEGDLHWPTLEVEKLADWAVRHELEKIRSGRLLQKLSTHKICVMYRALDLPLCTGVRRAMQINGFKQESIEPCQLYTLSLEAYKEKAFWSSEIVIEGNYSFHSLNLEHAHAVNASWKFRSESSLEKIKNIIASGQTMAAFEKNRPVSWIVTYENGSMGMLFTQQDHRRRGLASMVVKLLVQAHHMPTPKSRPFVYIEAGNHSSMQLFGERLGFQAEADVAWVRWIKNSADNSATESSSAGETKGTDPTTEMAVADVTLNSTAVAANRVFRPKGGTAISHSENLVKWEAWYGAGDGIEALSLPPWDTNGRPCFALRELLESVKGFKETYPRVIDIGCGTGSNSVWLANECGFQNVVGIDISPRAIVRAKARAKEACASVQFHCADIFKIPLHSRRIRFFD